MTANLTSNITSLAGVILNVVKMGVENGSTLEKVATVAADVVPDGVTSIFHLVTPGARLMARHSEAERGKTQLPVAFSQVMILMTSECESIAPVLNRTVVLDESEEILVSNVFKVLVNTLDLMGRVEHQLMSEKLRQLANAEEVESVECELKELEK